MKMHDINPQKQEVILLLHPMFTTAELMQTLLAKPLGDDYRYLIPDIAGHGEASDQIYQNAEKEADEIYQYLREQHISTIKLAFGASLGGVVLMELLKRPVIEYEQLFFEGTSFSQKAGFVNSVMKFVMIKKHRKAVAHPEIALERMGQLYGKTAAKPMAEQMVSINEKSIENIVWDCSHVQLPRLSLEQQKRCVFAYGEKDGDYKTAAKLQPTKYPDATMHVWKNYGHCTKITEDNLEYVQVLKQYL